MKLLLSLTTAAVATAAPAQVTCKLTVDNHIDTVKYNNVVLTATNGDASRYWTVAKHYTFTEAPGARLDVVGREDGHGGTCLGTQCSGFAMECQDSAGGAWDKFASTTDGSCKVSLVSDGTKYVPAVTTSGFSLTDSFGTGHTEIWGAGARHNEWMLFSCKPMTATEKMVQQREDAAVAAAAALRTVTCKLTVDNHIDTVKYNNIALAPTNYAALEHWTHTKIYTFQEVAGGRLDVVGRENGNGFKCLGTHCSGFAMECQDSAGGAWDKFASTTDGSCQLSKVSDGTKYVPAVTTSGFSLLDSFGTGHTEIWAQGAAHNEWILFSCAPMTANEVAEVAAADEQKCKVINANDFSSLPAMVASGWTSTGIGMVHHHHTGVGKATYDGSGAVCNNGDSNWWGWRGGAGVGRMEIQAPMDSFAEIDVGNCWNAGTVRVYAAGTEILAAKVGEGSEKAYFSVKKGDLISVRDEGANSVMRINSLKFYSCMADATAHVARTATEECEAIQANDFSSITKMMQVGWTPIGVSAHHHAGVGNHAAGAVCNTGKNNWWGWTHGAGVGQMEIDSPVTSTATIDFGNCWNQGEVKVYVDGREVGSAAVNVGSKVVSFAVKKGERISVRDEGANSVMRLNSLTFASCKHTECEPEFCSTWNCDMWCKCFEPTLTAVYESFNCFDDSDDSCSCN